MNAQYSTQGFSFQGYASDPEGKALGSVGITVKYTLYSGTNTNLTYAEEQNVTTDAYGVFTAIVGKGTSVSSETKTPFAALNLNLYAYKLKVEVKKTAGGSYTTLSDELLNAVPYARSAENGVPVGTIVAYGGDITKIPSGWVLCDGASKDGTQEEWKALFAVLGAAWGGSGNSFNLPDTKGRFLRAVDGGAARDDDAGTRTASNAGGNTGDKVGSFQPDIFKSHNHTASSSTDGEHTHTLANNHSAPYKGNNADSGSDISAVDNTDRKLNDPTSAAGNHSHTITVNNSGGAETRPENVSVYYIIKK